MKCPSCGLVTFDHLSKCPRCEASFAVRPLASGSMGTLRHLLRDEPELRGELRDRLHRARLDRRKQNENPLAAGTDPDAPDWFEPVADREDAVAEAARFPDAVGGERIQESGIVSADDLAPDDERRGGAAAIDDAGSHETDNNHSLAAMGSGEPEFTGEVPGFSDWREELRERLKDIRARREQQRQDDDADELALSAEDDEPVDELVEVEPDVEATREVADEEPDVGAAAGEELESKEPDVPEGDEVEGTEIEEAEEPELVAAQAMGEVVDLGKILRDNADAGHAAIDDVEISPEGLGWQGHENLPSGADDLLEPLAELEEAVDKAEAAMASDPLGPDAVLELIGGEDDPADTEEGEPAPSEIDEPEPGGGLEITETEEIDIIELDEPEEEAPAEPEARELEPEEDLAEFDLLDLDEIEQHVPETVEESTEEAADDETQEPHLDLPAAVMPPLPQEGEAASAPELDFEPEPAVEAPARPEIDIALDPDEDHDLAWDDDEDLVVTPAPAVDRSAGPLGERAAAALCDALVLLAIGGALITAASSASGRPMADILTGSGTWLGLAWAIFAVGYSIFFVGTCGQTIGRMVMKLRVIRSDQFTVGFDRAAVRLGAFLLAVLPLGAGLLPAVRDPQRRGLHDRLSYTRVVKA